MSKRVILPGGLKFLDLARSLAKEYGFHLVLIGDQMLAQLRSEGIACETLQSSPSSLDFENEALRGAARLLRAEFVPSLPPGIAGPPPDRLLEIMVEGAKKQFQSQILLREALAHLQEESPVALLVVNEDVTWLGKTAVLTARTLGIPSLVVSHGIPALRNLHDRIYADVMAVHGRREANWYISNGNDPAKLVVTGGPFWDEHYADLPSREDLCHRLNLDPLRPVVTYAATWVNDLSLVNDPGTVATSIDVLLRAVRPLQHREEVQLVVKLHPGDVRLRQTAQTFLRRGAELGVRIDGLFTSGLREVLAVSDVLLCEDSNAGVEALIHGKPVISLRTGPGAGMLFLEEDPVLVAHDAEELAFLLDRALYDLATRAHLRERRLGGLSDFNAGADGQSGRRVARLAVGLAEQGRLTADLRREVEVPDSRPLVGAREEAAQCDVSVVIAGHNEAPRLREGLPRLVDRLGEALTYEVVLVDDASEDETASVLASLSGDVRALVHHRPQGEARSLLKGAAVAKGRWLAFFEAADLAGPVETLAKVKDPECPPHWRLASSPGVGGIVVQRRVLEAGARWVERRLTGDQPATLGRLIESLQEVFAHMGRS
ncbi:MAG: glycosyltransferase [Betaproteobacteria bacterium]